MVKSFTWIWSVLLVFGLDLIKSTFGYGLGNCPKIDYIKHFNVTRFAGHWYEIERSFYLMELISSCVSVDLEVNSKGQLDVSVVSKSLVSGTYSISEGVATPSRKDPSILLYRVSSKLPRFISRYLPGAGFYQVLDTDYNDYAVLYSCTDFQIIHMDLVWIWARKKDICVKVRAKIYEMLTSYEIDPERLTLPKNVNCAHDY
ncbi:apolipoprotein D-like [Sitophilus oryzae]|uniref:Apolipoprotein D-like n=1 Tax=Sitophilus oryzae TaxID=7048 RepID=A0A6J2Y0H3_SITOR|nr:apolipoprotein D-like [Sitophilus oryzae]